jgi:2-amino-4-hydroxy-6-hydroxymethyldihydropteridine diphosphokinase
MYPLSVRAKGAGYKSLAGYPTGIGSRFQRESAIRNLLLTLKLSSMPTIAYLSLGSNIGDRAENLRTAIDHLRASGRVIAISSFYETEPVEFTDQPWFLNCAVALETEAPAQELLVKILDIEKKMGRQRTGQQKGPRILDIDIVLFGDVVVGAPGLTIPHPTMHQRRFVLEPLAEIAPNAYHPVLRQTVRELRDALPAGQAARRIENTEL